MLVGTTFSLRFLWHQTSQNVETNPFLFLGLTKLWHITELGKQGANRALITFTSTGGYATAFKLTPPFCLFTSTLS